MGWNQDCVDDVKEDGRSQGMDDEQADEYALSN